MFLDNSLVWRSIRIIYLNNSLSILKQSNREDMLIQLVFWNSKIIWHLCVRSICWDSLYECEWFLINNHPLDNAIWKSGFYILFLLKVPTASVTKYLLENASLFSVIQLFWSLLLKTWNYRMFIYIRFLSFSIQEYVL